MHIIYVCTWQADSKHSMTMHGGSCKGVEVEDRREGKCIFCPTTDDADAESIKEHQRVSKNITKHVYRHVITCVCTYDYVCMYHI